MSLLFTSDGKKILSAAQDSLKVWDMEKEGLLVDNIETNWRGIQDMRISEDEDTLFGVCFS
jgi:katanin p80 WD40 repeat-containing subunit B1